MKKPAFIPPSGLDAASGRVIRPLHEALSVILGDVDGELTPLPTSATLAEVVAQLNRVTARLNRSGQ